MHGLALIYILRNMGSVRQFKITQESLLHSRIQLVVDDEFDRMSIPEIARQVRARLGASVEVDIELVREIPAERSGKHRYVVSRVPTSMAPMTGAGAGSGRTADHA